MDSLARNDWKGVRRLFTPKLRESLTDVRLAAVWGKIVEKHGSLVSWFLVERRPLGDFVRFVFDLRFEHGEMIEVLSVEFTSNRVGGIFLNEKNAGPESQVSSSSLERSNEDEPTTLVTFGKSPFILSGVITMPIRHSADRSPAVLLIAGSGPQDRDETIGGIKPFRDLAEGLAREGIVSLRYDKRTAAHPYIFDACRSTVDDEIVNDAVEAIKVLRQLPYVDSNRIYLAGHSLGAFLIPEIAARAKGIAGLIMLAPPGRPITEIVLDQLRRKMNPDVRVLETMRQHFNELPDDTWWLGAPVSYWKDLEGRDEFATARRLGLRVLLVRGDRDENVSDEDLNRWVTALNANKRCVLRLPGVNHAMLKEQGSKIDPVVVRGIAEFILSSSDIEGSCPTGQLVN